MMKHGFVYVTVKFLSIQAQDFIEEAMPMVGTCISIAIPEHSSSGLH